ncbi:MAG: hypothetical protein WD231_00125 [Candidatus Woykebacteria bacterium]
MAFLKFPGSKKEVEDLLLIEIGLEVVNMAKLTLFPEPRVAEVARKGFSSLDEMFEASLQAVDELAGHTQDIPKNAILGVSGGPIKTETTVAQYTRPDPKEPIGDDEVEKVLGEVSAKAQVTDYKLFFSTIASATIDGTKVSNPIGLKGEKVALSCFIAYKRAEELAVFDKLIDEIDMKLEKIIPTSFAVAKTMLGKGDENTLLVRVGKERSEAALLTKGHIAEIIQFDLGVANPSHIDLGFEIALEKLLKEHPPELIELYPDSREVDLAELEEKISKLSWKELGVERAPHIKMVKEEDYEAEDTGLQALVSEATT